MTHNELLNSLRKKDSKVIESYATRPELLNRLLQIAAAPIPYSETYAKQLMNTNGTINMSGLGFQYVLQTTTLISADLVKQQFYEEPVAEAAPVLVGRGPWMESIVTNLTFDAAGPFEQGIQNQASRSAVSNVEVALSPITTTNKTWARGYSYNLIEMQKALASNNWDLVSSKQEALIKNWQLGIQGVGFLGLKGNASVPGLLTNTGVTVDDSGVVLPTMISNMFQGSYLAANAFNVFCSKIVQAFLTNCNEVKYPNRFAMPRADFVGLSIPVTVAGVPVAMTALEWLEKSFKGICGQDFKIIPTAYGNKARNAGYINGLANGANRYALYRADKETIHMDIPVDFTLGAPGTGNNFDFNAVGMGQFSGMNVFRIPEVMYFDAADSLA